tara:strand:+ start:5187 stop:5324 length:138 start_codon:yes stop_codon:yes gene_type:complete
LKSTSSSRKPTDKASGEATRRLEIIINNLQLEIEKLKTRVTALGG